MKPEQLYLRQQFDHRARGAPQTCERINKSPTQNNNFTARTECIFDLHTAQKMVWQSTQGAHSANICGSP
jgi:hypothetical protein